MKKIIIILTLSTALFAQSANPDALFLTDAQLKRLNDTQAAIQAATVQLELVKKVQENELLKIQLELGATPDKYESLSQIGDKFGFKRKPKEERPKP